MGFYAYRFISYQQQFKKNGLYQHGDIHNLILLVKFSILINHERYFLT